jgi:hypothetical protein
LKNLFKGEIRMKKILIVILGVLLGSQVFAQSLYTDIPQVAPKDTLYGLSRVTHDFYLNGANTFGTSARLAGPIDLHVYATLEEAGTADTLTVELYGIVKKLMAGSGTYTTNYVDSTRISAAVADSTFYVYPVDPFWTDFPIYDGLRVVLKKGGSDTDSVNTFIGFRVWPQGGRP